jgi:hypothetical protein
MYEATKVNKFQKLQREFQNGSLSFYRSKTSILNPNSVRDKCEVFGFLDVFI